MHSKKGRKKYVKKNKTEKNFKHPKKLLTLNYFLDNI